MGMKEVFDLFTEDERLALNELVCLAIEPTTLDDTTHTETITGPTLNDSFVRTISGNNRATIGHFIPRQQNCINCGAPVQRNYTECPYCGTIYLD